MNIETIQEGVLNDDILYIADKGKIFKGGYEAVLEFWTYQNTQSNNKNIRRFKTYENAQKFILKNYKTNSTKKIENDRANK